MPRFFPSMECLRQHKSDREAGERVLELLHNQAEQERMREAQKHYINAEAAVTICDYLEAFCKER